MLSLRKREMQIYNNMLISMYGMNDVKKLQILFLKDIRTLIPYNQGSFQTISTEWNKFVAEDSYFVDVEEKMIPLFDNINSDKEYLRNFMNYGHSIVYMDSEVLEKDIREKNEFYRLFMKPQDLSYSCGIVLINDGRCLGIVTFFRKEEWGDFTDKEIFILELFKTHMTNIMAECIFKRNKVGMSEEKSVTPREKEIIELILKGYANEEIAKELYISLSTTKKHIYNIFKKYGVKNRIAFVKTLEKSSS